MPQEAVNTRTYKHLLKQHKLRFSSYFVSTNYDLRVETFAKTKQRGIRTCSSKTAQVHFTLDQTYICTNKKWMRSAKLTLYDKSGRDKGFLLRGPAPKPRAPHAKRTPPRAHGG